MKNVSVLGIIHHYVVVVKVLHTAFCISFQLGISFKQCMWNSTLLNN